MWRGVVRMVGSCRLEAGLGDTLSKNLERLDPRARTGNKRGLSEPPQGASSAAPVRVRGAAELFRKGIPQACPTLMRRTQTGSGDFPPPPMLWRTGRSAAPGGPSWSPPAFFGILRRLFSPYSKQSHAEHQPRNKRRRLPLQGSGSPGPAVLERAPQLPGPGRPDPAQVLLPVHVPLPQ